MSVWAMSLLGLEKFYSKPFKSSQQVNKDLILLHAKHLALIIVIMKKISIAPFSTIKKNSKCLTQNSSHIHDNASSIQL